MSIIKKLFDATRNNNVRIMSNLISEEGVKEYIDILLVEASKLGHLEIVQYLIEDAPDHLKANIHFEGNRPFLWVDNSY